ncbi:hypothetical protein D3C72_2528180 [compost metagenome]
MVPKSAGTGVLARVRSPGSLPRTAQKMRRTGAIAASAKETDLPTFSLMGRSASWTFSNMLTKNTRAMMAPA